MPNSDIVDRNPGYELSELTYTMPEMSESLRGRLIENFLDHPLPSSLIEFMVDSSGGWSFMEILRVCGLVSVAREGCEGDFEEKVKELIELHSCHIFTNNLQSNQPSPSSDNTPHQPFDIIPYQMLVEEESGGGMVVVVDVELFEEVKLMCKIQFNDFGQSETSSPQTLLSSLSSSSWTGGGVILNGPASCGKTHLLRQLALDLGCSLMVVHSHLILSPFLGESEQRLRRAFEIARKTSSSSNNGNRISNSGNGILVVIDNIDIFGGRRSSSGDDESGEKGSNVKNRLLSTLLTELDGIDSTHSSNNDISVQEMKDSSTYGGNKMFVIGTTRDVKSIDQALIRPGRFSKIYHLDHPLLLQSVNRSEMLENDSILDQGSIRNEEEQNCIVTNLFICCFLEDKMRFDDNSISGWISDFFSHNYELVSSFILFHFNRHSIMISNSLQKEEEENENNNKKIPILFIKKLSKKLNEKWIKHLSQNMTNHHHILLSNDLVHSILLSIIIIK